MGPRSGAEWKAVHQGVGVGGTEGRAVNCNQAFLTDSQRGNSMRSGEASLDQESWNGCLVLAWP